MGNSTQPSAGSAHNSASASASALYAPVAAACASAYAPVAKPKPAPPSAPPLDAVHMAAEGQWGVDFTKSDLIAIASYVTQQRRTDDMQMFALCTEPELRAAIRVAVYVNQRRFGEPD